MPAASNDVKREKIDRPNVRFPGKNVFSFIHLSTQGVLNLSFVDKTP